ncbi:MAG: sulfotransferase [Gammaproteobacteria bacterium]|nr:sulfotransferase [Gammaproteobacteria bacterium]
MTDTIFENTAKNDAVTVAGGSQTLTEKMNAALDENNAVLAFSVCNEHLEQHPEDAQAHRHLGLLHAASNKPGSAITSGKRACALTPDDPQAWSDLGRIYAIAGQMDNACLCFNESITIDVKFADGWHNLGTACKQMGKRDLAFSALKNALLIDDTRAETYLNLGTLLIQASQFEDALECLERAVKQDPSLVAARSRLGNQMSQNGKVKRAESLFRQSLGMNPDHLEGWLGLGRTLEDMGEADGALSAYLNVLNRRPDHSMALGQYLSLLPKDAEPELLPIAKHAQQQHTPNWMQYGESTLRDEKVKDEAKALIGYGLTKYHNKRKDYQAAASAGLLASSARQATAGRLDRAALAARVDQMINTYTAEFFTKHKRLGLGTDQPVFIVGLPRSGTTLTEQILSAHPQLHGAGELADLGRLAALTLSENGDADSAMWQAALLLAEPTAEGAKDGNMQSRLLAGKYLESLRDGTQTDHVRISDKSPLNFFQLGFAALLFPNAKVVHCHRNGRDNALSIWMENFNPDQQWSTDFNDLAFYRKQYQRIMAHWQAVLPLQIFDMPYENTVADLAGQASGLIEFLGVPWHDECLNFHKNERAVQTPSRWQVRQPIYTRSVERWKAYQPYLPDLYSAFSDDDARD